MYITGKTDPNCATYLIERQLEEGRGRRKSSLPPEVRNGYLAHNGLGSIHGGAPGFKAIRLALSPPVPSPLHIRWDSMYTVGFNVQARKVL